MNPQPCIAGLIVLVLVFSVLALPPAPSAVWAEQAAVYADTPTPEPPTPTPAPPTPTPTATWSGKLFIPFGGRAEPTPTLTPTATAPPETPPPPVCVFPTPETPGIVVEQGEWMLVDGQWVVHRRAANSRIVIRFTTPRLISLWSVDNERKQANARPAEAHLDNGIVLTLPWTGDMEILPVPDGPWTTQTITVRAASGDSPGIRWCQWP